MKHFLEISQLSLRDVTHLIQRALHFKKNAIYPVYSSCPVINLFYENSTRTRVSFELAAKHLGMPVVNLDLQSSSESKGEVIEDTFRTLAAMGVKLFVIRHAEDGLPQRLADLTDCDIRIINAGDGKHAHPSQAMLDFMTIMERKPELNHIKIAIVGNIRHSRVANSLQCLSATLGVGELVMVAPKCWQPVTVHYGNVTDSLQDGLKDADVVICLRVQKERLLSGEELDLAQYHREYGLTGERLACIKSDTMIMHPGPINRGVEISNDVADGPQSFILEQVKNGVFMRMAILESLSQSF